MGSSIHQPAQQPLYSSRIVDTYLQLLRHRYPRVDRFDLLQGAGMTPHEVGDPGHWFTQEQINRFHDRLQLLTRNPAIAREAGRFAASPDTLGFVRSYVLGMISPAQAFAMIGKAAGQFTRSCDFASRPLAANRVEVTVTPRPAVHEQPFQCQNRIGFLESIPLGFAYKLPLVEHPQCIFRGDPVCRYVIAWEETLPVLFNRFRLRGTLALLSVLGAAAITFPHPWLRLGLLAGFPTLLLLGALAAEKLQKREWRRSLDHLTQTADRLLVQVETNYNNALMIGEIGQALADKSTLLELMEAVMTVTRKRLDFDRGMILTANPGGDRLVFETGFGYETELLDALRQTVFHLDNPASRGVFVTAFHQQRPFLVNDIDEIAADLSERSLAFARRLGSKAFICCPIVSNGRSIGVLAVDNTRSKRPLVQSDLSLLIGIAAVVGITAHNLRLLEARKRQFQSILQVMAATIDARDAITSGHSAKVTEYTLGICDRMGLSRDYREMMQVASLLHDYGKIGVPDAILKKPGRLSSDEFGIVRHHAEKTRLILEQIEFEGIYRQVPEIAGGHHEKLDGSGYPRGLRGEEIPVGARILAVADFFEAVTAKRHYRDPMSAADAIRLLREQSGLSFDRQVVEAFLNYYTATHPEIYPTRPNA
jgi:HD-GYP domain-containing protein (c-di-GMP phosphodiesterase class II)